MIWSKLFSIVDHANALQPSSAAATVSVHSACTLRGLSGAATDNQRHGTPMKNGPEGPSNQQLRLSLMIFGTAVFGGAGGNRTRVRKPSTERSTYLVQSFDLTVTTRTNTLRDGDPLDLAPGSVAISGSGPILMTSRGLAASSLSAS